ncbi:unnamed protein product [Agarophyton chilense]
MPILHRFPLLLVTILFNLHCSDALPLPGEHPIPGIHPVLQPIASEPRQSHAIPTSIVRGFLLAIIIPVLCRFITDCLDNLSSRFPAWVSLLYFKIFFLIGTYIISVIAGLTVFIYSVIVSSFEFGCTGIGILLGIYSGNYLSLTSSSSLRKIWRCKPRFKTLSEAGKRLLPHALKLLIRLAMSPHFSNHLPFNMRLDLVIFYLEQLPDVHLLEAFLNADTSIPLRTCLSLQELHRQIPRFMQLQLAAWPLLPDAFRSLVKGAFEQDYSNTLPFTSRIKLVAYCVELNDRDLLEVFLHRELGNSSTFSLKLEQLLGRLPDPSLLPGTGRKRLPHALKNLLQLASNETSSIGIPFHVQVELVMLYLKLSEPHSNEITLPDWIRNYNPTQNGAAVVPNCAEFHWILEWARRFQETLSAYPLPRREVSPGDVKDAVNICSTLPLPTSIPEQHEDHVIRLVTAVYARIKSLGSTHPRLYSWFMQQECAGVDVCVRSWFPPRIVSDEN